MTDDDDVVETHPVVVLPQQLSHSEVVRWLERNEPETLRLAVAEIKAAEYERTVAEFNRQQIEAGEIAHAAAELVNEQTSSG